MLHFISGPDLRVIWEHVLSVQFAIVVIIGDCDDSNGPVWKYARQSAPSARHLREWGASGRDLRANLRHLRATCANTAICAKPVPWRR